MTFRHWSRVTPYTSSCELAECCVFAKQSPGPLRCGPPPLTPRGGSRPRAPLFPKLRGQFAEFLNVVALAHLRLLALSTCVGLRYGFRVGLDRLGAFPGGRASADPLCPRTPRPVASQACVTGGFSCPVALHAWTACSSRQPAQHAASPRRSAPEVREY